MWNYSQTLPHSKAKKDIRQAARTQTPRNDLLYAQCSMQQGRKSQRVAKKSRYITEKRWCICLHSLCYYSNFTANMPSIAIKLGGGRCCQVTARSCRLATLSKAQTRWSIEGKGGREALQNHKNLPNHGDISGVRLLSSSLTLILFPWKHEGFLTTRAEWWRQRRHYFISALKHITHPFPLLWDTLSRTSLLPP